MATNSGVWNAAISTSQELSDRFWFTELWFPDSIAPTVDLPVKLYQLRSQRLIEIDRIIKDKDLKKDRDIIVTHGCWSYCTRWGRVFQRHGFNWIYTPHGMLEPWALKQKSFKKKTYFRFIEKPSALSASAIRAVSDNEMQNLKSLFNSQRIETIPNGIKLNSFPSQKRKALIQYLFLGRLHKKKGILELVDGWKKSILNNDMRYRLVIAGPDDGELSNLKARIPPNSNIQYVGPKYGKEKGELLAESTFFVLPSHSEGFPTSILEAMSYGLTMLVSSGCNFPQIFQQQFGIQTEPDAENIQQSLLLSSEIGKDVIESNRQRARQFVESQFSLDSIALNQIQLYQDLLIQK